MPIADADYWMVRRDSDRCILLSHDRGMIVANKLENDATDGEEWELLVRLDGEEIHDESHTVGDKAELWTIIEEFGERFEDE